MRYFYIKNISWSDIHQQKFPLSGTLSVMYSIKRLYNRFGCCYFAVDNVHLTSSVQPGSDVYPEQLPITFTCITRDSGFVDWRYNNNEDHVSVTMSDQLGQPVYAGSNYFYVTLVNITHTNTGEMILLSKLYLNELIHNVTTVTCRNGDHQGSTNITVYRSGKPAASIILIVNTGHITYWYN